MTETASAVTLPFITQDDTTQPNMTRRLVPSLSRPYLFHYMFIPTQQVLQLPATVQPKRAKLDSSHYFTAKGGAEVQ